MNTRSQKIYGPAGLLVMTAMLILLLFSAGVAIGLTRTKCGEVGLSIRNLDAENRDLVQANRSYEELKARATDVLSLKDSLKDRLQPPSPGQVVLVRRRLSFRQAAERTVPADPRFTALDIAFINTGASRGTAMR